MVSELRLMHSLRLVSRLCVAVGILVSTLALPFGGVPLELQVLLALVALAVGIPHGAVDHLITVPSLTLPQRVFFLAGYLGAVGLSIWCILSANLLGFQVVVLMSAIHFGLGDTAFVAEIDRRGTRHARLPRTAFLVASGFSPVVIPLVSSSSSQALEAVNPELVGWAGALAPILFAVMVTLNLAAIFWMLIIRRYQDAIDLVMLLVLVLVAPPLIAFAFYFGLWHALRHTGRVSLELKSSRVRHKADDPRGAFVKAFLAGVPALIAVLIFTVALGLTQGFNLGQDLLWYLLVVVWALTVPHMLLTLRLDVKALRT